MQRDHVLISGWGSGARHLAADLAARGIGVTVITLNPDGAAEAEGLGHEVVRGDSTKAHILGAAGIERALVVVVADDAPEMAVRIAGVVSSVAPRVPLIVRSRDDVELEDLLEVGVQAVVTGDRASSDALVEAVLRRLPEGRPTTTVDTARVVHFRPETPCAHVDDSTVRAVLPSAPGCTACLRTDQQWVHLRMCAGCGYVGCCDSSPGRHASTHAAEQEHPVMCSVEPGESWGWCYLDSARLESAATPGVSAPAGR